MKKTAQTTQTGNRRRENHMKMKKADRSNFQTERILANGITRNNDSYQTGLNNNDLIVGPSGSGKTRGYVNGNILRANESMVISDPKGKLYNRTHKKLEKAGYEVIKHQSGQRRVYARL